MEEYDLLQCIDRGLDPFGSHVKQTIYWRMAILHGSSHDGIVANPRAFVAVLEELFGDSAIGIEKSIVKEIRKIFDLSFEEADSVTTLTEVIDQVKERIIPVSTGIRRSDIGWSYSPR